MSLSRNGARPGDEQRSARGSAIPLWFSCESVQVQLRTLAALLSPFDS